jgi:CHAD domain-containing protein
MAASKQRTSTRDPRAHAGRVGAGLLRTRLGDVWKALHAACEPEAVPEDVHRLRVATRRGTAALAAFRELMPSKQRSWFKKRLARLRRTAGKARDLDLLAERMAADSGTTRSRLAKTLAGWRKKSRQPLGEQLEQLVAKDWRQRVDRLLDHMRGCQTAAFGGFARHRLAPMVTRFLRASSGSLGRPAELHALRIECKKLRYAFEIFGTALPAAAGERCRRALTRLQDILGVFTDHVAAAERLERLAHRDKSGGRREDLLALADDEWRRAAQARRSFRTWWSRSRQRAVRRRIECTLRRRFA